MKIGYFLPDEETIDDARFPEEINDRLDFQWAAEDAAKHACDHCIIEPNQDNFDLTLVDEKRKQLAIFSIEVAYEPMFYATEKLHK